MIKMRRVVHRVETFRRKLAFQFLSSAGGLKHSNSQGAAVARLRSMVALRQAKIVDRQSGGMFRLAARRLRAKNAKELVALWIGNVVLLRAVAVDDLSFHFGDYFPRFPPCNGQSLWHVAPTPKDDFSSSWPPGGGHSFITLK
jgi:hypothetical protein